MLLLCHVNTSSHYFKSFKCITCICVASAPYQHTSTCMYQGCDFSSRSSDFSGFRNQNIYFWDLSVETHDWRTSSFFLLMPFTSRMYIQFVSFFFLAEINFKSALNLLKKCHNFRSKNNYYGIAFIHWLDNYILWFQQ